MENKNSIDDENPPITRGIFYLKALIVLISLILSLQGFSQAKLKFEDSKKNFGFVKKGEIVTLEYEFTNQGTEPLIITEAKVECSCTSVDFPKEPIGTKQIRKITVKFDTKSVYDRQDRTIEIYSNASDSPASIRFKGVVLKK